MAARACRERESLWLLLLLCSLCSCAAHTFYVGGDDGWRNKPCQNYNKWAKTHRFQINDQIVFKYKEGHDSVLVVSKRDYSKCNKENPIRVFKDGDSKFKLNRSGPFFFISGHDQNCEKGQKFVLVVRSDRHVAPAEPPSQSPAPGTPGSLPPVKTPFHSPAPSPAAKAPVHTPGGKTPSHSPSPSAAVEAPAPAPGGRTPSHSPSSSPAAEAPAHAPGGRTPSHSPSPSPAARVPVHPPQPSHSPTPSPAAKTPAHPPAVINPHTHTPTPSPAAKYPSHPDEPVPHSPSPSPAANTQIDKPPVHPPSPSPHQHRLLKALYPPFFPPHLAPEPNPSAATDLVHSILTLGLSLAAAVMFAGVLI